MDETQALQRMDNPLPVAVRPMPTAVEILQAVVEKGVTSENVDAVTKLAELCEHMEDRNAAKEFARAFTKLQAAIPNVKANKAVPDGRGGVKFTYATPEEIMRQVQPFLTQYGFTLSHSQRLGEGTVTVVCTLIHECGHSRTNEFTVRAVAPHGGTARDADVGAGTVAQREAVCDCLNIVRVRPEADPRLEGTKISKALAEELERRVAETNSDKAKFLQLAQAATFAEILSNKYEVLDQLLVQKERKGR